MRPLFVVAGPAQQGVGAVEDRKRADDHRAVLMRYVGVGVRLVIEVRRVAVVLHAQAGGVTVSFSSPSASRSVPPQGVCLAGDGTAIRMSECHIQRTCGQEPSAARRWMRKNDPSSVTVEPSGRVAPSEYLPRA